MRVALVIPGGVDRSGEYRVIPALLALIGRLAAQHDLEVFALTQEEQPGEWQLAGARIHNIGTRRTRLRAIRTIYAAARMSPFDLVHAIWSGHCGLVAVAVARMLGIPSLIHIAGGELVALPDIDYGGALTWRARLRETVVLRAASAVTAASAPMIESLSGLCVKARRIPLGVDLAAWPPRQPMRRDLTKPARLIHVASLNKVKDQKTLLQALALLRDSNRDFTVDVIGEDTLRGEVQALAVQLRLSDRITFHGFLPQRLLRPLVARAALMIVSSRHEAGPLAVLEAAVLGVPSVGAAVGHLAEWAPHAALAVPVGDSTELAVAIGTLLDDEELRLSLAMEASVRAIREDADYTARQFHAMYENLTAPG